MILKKKLSASGLLYVVIDKEIVDTFKINILDFSEELANSPADLIQLRAKKMADSEFLTLAKKLALLFKRKKKTFIVNDRADIALLAGADGLHLGSFDIPQEDARRLIGQKLLLGKTINNLTELKKTDQKKIDYLSLGPLFLSQTKMPNRTPLKKQEIENILGKNKKVIFAIGGINRYNVGSVLEYGITNIAVSSAIISAIQPKKEVESLKKCLKKVF